MKKLILGLVLCAQAALAQVSPPPATSTEVIVGVDTYKYVSPAALAQAGIGPGGATNGITATTSSNLSYRISSTNSTTGTASSSYSSNLIPASVYVVTNSVINRSNIFVTGNGSALVNGTYTQMWYNASSLQGAWHNTASTNIIYQNDPGGNISGQSFVIEGGTNSVSFMYSNPEVLGLQGHWNNPFQVEGTAFSGTATLTWGTNNSNIAILSVLERTNAIILSGMVSTNIMRVSLDGNDLLANRTNGYPFKTLWSANQAAVAMANDMILVDPGVYTNQPPFYIKRGTHILGSGRATVVSFSNDDDTNSPYGRFQSKLIAMTDSSSLGNILFTNSSVGLTQFDGDWGGSNIWVHDMWIYPPKTITWGDDQANYSNIGVRSTRIGFNNVLERVRVYAAVGGFFFDLVELNTQNTNNNITLIDCEAQISTEWAKDNSSQPWTNGSFSTLGGGKFGGMIPIGFVLDSAGAGIPGFAINIVGGRFSTLNGTTNSSDGFLGATNASRNACIYISRAYNADVRLTLANNPLFIYGSTNTTSTFILNETTNNNFYVSGSATVKAVRSTEWDIGTNISYFASRLVGDGSGLTNISGASAATFNANQFSASALGTNLKSGLVFTNARAYDGLGFGQNAPSGAEGLYIAQSASFFFTDSSQNSLIEFATTDPEFSIKLADGNVKTFSLDTGTANWSMPNGGLTVSAFLGVDGPQTNSTLASGIIGTDSNGKLKKALLSGLTWNDTTLTVTGSPGSATNTFFVTNSASATGAWTNSYGDSWERRSGGVYNAIVVGTNASRHTVISDDVSEFANGVYVDTSGSGFFFGKVAPSGIGGVAGDLSFGRGFGTTLDTTSDVTVGGNVPVTGKVIGNGGSLTNIPVTGLWGSGGTNTAATNGTAGQVFTSSANGGGYWSTPSGSSGVLRQKKIFTLTSTIVTGTTPGWTNILSGSFTPTASDSIIIITAFAGISGTSGLNIIAARIANGATPITVGDSAGSRIQVSQFTASQNSGGAFMFPMPVMATETAASTSSRTYNLQATVETGGALYVNRSATDTDGANFGRGATVMTIEEIAP